MLPAHVLSKNSVLVIFTYAPAGLGHLRVSDALYDGLPTGTSVLLLGAHDQTITYLHRLTSIHSIGKRLLEWTQSGTQEDIFTKFYRYVLRSTAKETYQQLETILSQRFDQPNTVIIVATHFGLAHQIAALKPRLEKEKKVKIFLAVQVTDDSPQHIWYVEGADITIVPSESTRTALLAYGRHHQLLPIRIAVAPYPVSPSLSKQLSEDGYKNRLLQVSPMSQKPVHIAIPVSGAAVGLTYLSAVVSQLHHKPRFQFHVISKDTPYTQPFIREFLSRSRVSVAVGSTDREVVNIYEEEFKKQVIALEITKPSEQTFKALLCPNRVGGVILLFATPVGRQEYDNLDFLRRHDLLPSVEDHFVLWKKALQVVALTHDEQKLWHTKAKNWRGVRLPAEPKAAAQFITWLLQSGIFTAMMQCQVHAKAQDRHADELSPNGVERFWKIVGEQVRSKLS